MLETRWLVALVVPWGAGSGRRWSATWQVRSADRLGDHGDPVVHSVLQSGGVSFRLYVAFIREERARDRGVTTGNRVHSLTVSPNAGGMVYTSGGNWLTAMFVSSAGYLGAMAYGTALLVLIRRSVSPRAILYASAIPILVLTLVYGWGSAFTIIAGVLLAAALIAVGRFARPAIAGFLVALLAVQCIVNAFFDLRTRFAVLSTPSRWGAHRRDEHGACHAPPGGLLGGGLAGDGGRDLRGAAALYRQGEALPQADRPPREIAARAARLPTSATRRVRRAACRARRADARPPSERG
ncbi:MAG: M50 family metallopeptidase [Thermomicrobiales bacterium]